MADWQSRSLDAVYPMVFIDAIHVKIRDGKVADRPIYTAVTVEGERDILGPPKPRPRNASSDIVRSVTRRTLSGANTPTSGSHNASRSAGSGREGPRHRLEEVVETGGLDIRTGLLNGFDRAAVRP
jgi:Transposase, Mutator family